MYPTDPALVDAIPVVRAALDVADRSRRPDPASRSASADSWPVTTTISATPMRCCRPASVRLGVWISRPLAWSFVATVDPEFWAPCFDYLGLDPPGADRIRRPRVHHLRHRLAADSRSMCGSR